MPKNSQSLFIYDIYAKEIANGIFQMSTTVFVCKGAAL